MIKNKIDYKLMNCALIMVIIFLLYKTGDIWMGVVSKIWQVIFPFFIAFIINNNGRKINRFSFLPFRS